ncbi:hypothetical protein F9B77_03690 [Staphylococcus epidermidis]|uniref:Uncharacterized protein n=4 Tax=Staphylococcus TaxID=1279 RepID=Q5HQX1_STAEQ|nr:hypothetical protein SE_0540 [Staphylococcus epidermidis ATCC 12228]AAW53839.1 hypothetical protein SERP0425 [Staphylococcus epidermidis RP62A]ARG67232.1 hypothetical protein B4U56_09905 [Staphylococcus epidermidis]MCZ2500610.1 hypothetical protein [Xylophilus sp. Kf1]TBW74095.1 hypothetical protein EQ811_13290 [Staphylococcus capitis]TBW83877.1 hypothetical protein EQ804_11955 [Staphylococcus hominis]
MEHVLPFQNTPPNIVIIYKDFTHLKSITFS